ncbi:MAG TPA: hypothetical protein VN255_18750, partial [Mycobacterium sp.]|nr:hypothetical protein [Mycobacterium sp.]
MTLPLESDERYQEPVIVENMVLRDKPRMSGIAAAEKVVQAAADLLRSGGVEAVSTRAVAA